MSIPTPTPTNHDPNRGRFSELRQSGGYRGTTLMLSLLVLVMLIVGAVFTAISARPVSYTHLTLPTKRIV